MEREANYAAVGAFVLLVLGMAVAFIYWYSDAREVRSYVRYEVYFNGSVAGLSEGSAVRYLGVDIGRVVRMRIDSRASDRVQVLVDLDSTAPVSPRTVAQLSMQGVTGLLYIDLRQDKAESSSTRILEGVPSERYPVIRAAGSNLDVFVASLPELTARFGEISARINGVLSDTNIAALSRLLVNLDAAGNDLPATMRETRALVADLRTATAAAAQTFGTLRGATETAAPELAAAIQRLRITADNFANASERLDAMIAENRDDLRGFVRDGLPQLEALLREGRDAAQEFRLFSRSLRDNPSQILYQPASGGVEIPR